MNRPIYPPARRARVRRSLSHIRAFHTAFAEARRLAGPHRWYIGSVMRYLGRVAWLPNTPHCVWRRGA